MFPSRIAAQASRTAARNARINVTRQNVRRYADSASGGSSGGANHYVGGAIGGAAASVAIFGLWYQFSGVGKAAQSVGQAKSYIDSTAEQLKIQFKENTPETNEVIDTLKQSAYKYATFIPGGREYVDKVFKDIEVIRKNHGGEVDNIVKEAYGELRSTSKKGVSWETAVESWQVLSKYLQQLASLAVDAGQDILDNHPEVKNKLGGSFDQLKQFGDNLGPEAKKQVNETYDEIKDVVNQGIQWDTVEKIRKLVQEKVESLKKLRDQAWEEGYKQLQSKLQDNPEVKKLVEENADVLKNGNITEAIDKVKSAVSSGDMGSLNEYIQSAKNKADQFSSSSISSWLTAIPGGSAILPQLQKLRQVAESRGPEAEKLAKDTMNDLKEVLDKRSEQVEELAKKAGQESKK